MGTNEVIQIVSTLGFPIVMCFAMGWYVKYITDKHTSETNALKEAINSNTQVITEMKSMMQTFMSYMAKTESGGG